MAIDHIPKKDSDGFTHYVDKQDEPMSCALSCIGMVWEQTRKQCSVRQESGYKLISGMFPRSLLWSQILGENNGLGNGTWADNVEKTLSAVGVTRTATDSFTPTTGSYGFSWQKNRIRDRHPAIILVGWYSGTGANFTRNGGHFIVAARCTTKNFVVVLDPASGTLHELVGSQGLYFNHGLQGKMEIIIYTG